MAERIGRRARWLLLVCHFFLLVSQETTSLVDFVEDVLFQEVALHSVDVDASA